MLKKWNLGLAVAGFAIAKYLALAQNTDTASVVWFGDENETFAPTFSPDESDELPDELEQATWSDCAWGNIPNGTACSSARLFLDTAAALGTGGAITAALMGGIAGGPWMAFEYLYFVQLTASGAIMDLPHAPQHFVSYCTNFFWSMFAIFPFDGTMIESTCRPAFIPENFERLHSIVTFGGVLNVLPQRLMLSAVAGTVAVCCTFVIVGLIGSVLKSSCCADRSSNSLDSRMPVKILLHACNLTLYLAFMPLVLFSLYAFYAVFISPDPLTGCNFESAAITLGGSCVVTLLVVWTWAMSCTGIHWPGKNGFHPGWNRFLLLQMLVQFIRAITIGFVMLPKPVQPVAVLATNMLYGGIVLCVTPFKTEVDNKTSILVSFLAVLNGIIPMFFGTDEALFDKAAADYIGTIHISINVASMLLLALVAGINFAMRYLDNQSDADRQELLGGFGGSNYDLEASSPVEGGTRKQSNYLLRTADNEPKPETSTDQVAGIYETLLKAVEQLDAESKPNTTVETTGSALSCDVSNTSTVPNTALAGTRAVDDNPAASSPAHQRAAHNQSSHAGRAYHSVERGSDDDGEDDGAQSPAELSDYEEAFISDEAGPFSSSDDDSGLYLDDLLAGAASNVSGTHSHIQFGDFKAAAELSSAPADLEEYSSSKFQDDTPPLFDVGPPSPVQPELGEAVDGTNAKKSDKLANTSENSSKPHEGAGVEKGDPDPDSPAPEALNKV